MNMWSHMEQNYESMQKGEKASFKYDPNAEIVVKGGDASKPKPEYSNNRPKFQPYMKKGVASQSVIASKPVLYGKAAPEQAPPAEVP